MYRSLLKAAFLIFAFGLGFLLREYLDDATHIKQQPAKERADAKGRKPPGFWFQAEKKQPSEETLNRLAALGYVDGSQKASAMYGAVVYEPSLMQPGLNFYTSGHAPEAILMDSNGKTLHRWKMRFDRAFPDADSIRRKALGTRFFRTAHLFENGDILAIYEGVGLIKLDKNSKILWTYAGAAHHDIDVQPDGTIYALTRTPRIISALNDGQPVLEDFVTILTGEGQEIRKISILKAVQSSIYGSALDTIQEFPNGDIFHTNTVKVLDGSLSEKASFLKKGNILLSLCFANMVAVLDPTQEKIVWALSDMWRKQHIPTFLPDGDLLVFDNNAGNAKSRVVQINPLTQKIRWSYESPDFYSEILGYAQRLNNGNTLIVDSDDGKAFEITAYRKKVWEFSSPHRAGSNHEYVAVLPELVRLDPNFPHSWVD